MNRTFWIVFGILASLTTSPIIFHFPVKPGCEAVKVESQNHDGPDFTNKLDRCGQRK